MFNKKIKLFLVTLVFMLSISAIAAADTNSTDDLIAGDVEEEPPSGSVQDVSINNSLEAARGSYELSSNDVNMYYRNGSSYDVTLLRNSEPVQNEKLSVNINGVVFNRVTDESGTVSIPISLNSGSYAVSTSYKDVTVKNKINILPVVEAKDLTTTYKSTKQFSAKFLDNQGNPLKDAYVKFIVNGKTYTKKTNSYGIATLSTYVLNVGTYTIYSVHPNGYKKSNRITVKTSVIANNLEKHYASYKTFSALFYGTDGKVLANKYVKFYRSGEYFYVKTNGKGVASLSVISKPGSFKMVSINPATGEKKTNTVTILPTLYANKVITFSDRTATFNVKLYKNEQLVKNAAVYVYIKGVKKTLKTNDKGVASVNFKLAKGTYVFTSIDPYTGYSIKTAVYVKLASIKSSDLTAFDGKTSTYKAILLKQDGTVAKNTNMQITLNGKTYTVKTDTKGVANLNFNLKKGSYTVVCKDLSTGYTKSNTIKVCAGVSGMKFNKYGVSSDGKYILAIGRPSAPGDASSYTWYKTVFERTCPYCHGHNLYWDVFWAGNEYTDAGIFPATGNKEPGSIEGMIFCADCDCDFSVFGNEHVWEDAMHLTIVSPTVSSSKAEAYALKSGSYVYP